MIRGASGKTVEVINTDAEGRLILGDALWYAREKMGATHLVDVATLTGACVVALGRITIGDLRHAAVVGRHRARDAARGPASGCGRCRSTRNTSEQLKSEIADMANVGGRAGRRDHRRAVPEGVRRRAAVGPPRHRRHRVGRRAEAVLAEGRHRRRGPHAGRAGVHGVPLGGSDSLSCVASGSSALLRRVLGPAAEDEQAADEQAGHQGQQRPARRPGRSNPMRTSAGPTSLAGARRRQLHDRRHRLKQGEHTSHCTQFPPVRSEHAREHARHAAGTLSASGAAPSESVTWAAMVPTGLSVRV